MLLDDVWPVRGLKVTGPVVQLVVPDEQRLSELAALAADGVYDPQNQYLPRSPVAGWEGGEPLEAQRSFLRYVWAASADWSPTRWNLVLAAVVDDRCVGVQEVGAKDFAVTRTVSTGSWLAREHQGRGYGRAMREAVLTLAFDLGADRAESAAWSHNGPSLGVSRALGYRPNGTTVRVWRGQRHEQADLVLHRRDWVAPQGVTLSGLSDDARRFLGAPSRTDGEI
ncbi:GNAT family protein [Kineococcus endophyticus]|uniref:GNAT family protein n=1 Tax=Kineococcus endophyticus TaxID=1181883 RepID=A0ABV3PCJ9_9ACTN